MTFLTILRITKILCRFRRKNRNKIYILESSRSEFLEKFSANNFALLDPEDNTYGPFNSRAIADLPLLRTLLAIRQKYWKPSFWEVIDSFVLLAYASLAASRTLLQRLLVCQRLPISTRIVISYAMKWDIPWWIWWKVNGNWNNMIKISQWGKAIVEQILASEEINKPKRAGLWEPQSGIQVGKLIIWVRSFEIEKL